MGIKVLLIGISLLEMVMLDWLLCGTVLEKQYFQKKEWVIICVNIVGVGVGEGINRSLLFFSQNVFLTSVAVTCICVVVINRQNKLLKTIVVVLYYTIVALADFFMAFLSMIALRNEFKDMVYVYAGSLMESMLFICARVIIAACIYLIVRQKFAEAYIREFQSVLLMIMIIMCLMLRRYQVAIVRMMCEGKEQEAGATGLSLMGAVLVILFTGMVYLKYKALKKEKELLTMRDAMVTQRFMELEEVMEKNRQLSHDLKHHVLVLKNFEKEGNYEGIHNYLEEINHEFLEIKKRAWTGNEIADMLLEQKRALAEQEGITFMIQAVPIAEWLFQNSETCSLLGNLLDNAIEACRRMDCNINKWISIKIENQKRLLFIIIENSVDKAPIMKNGRPISVKPDRLRHGYGLKSVERIVNKYEGMIMYQSKDRAFQVKLLF